MRKSRQIIKRGRKIQSLRGKGSSALGAILNGCLIMKLLPAGINLLESRIGMKTPVCGVKLLHDNTRPHITFFAKDIIMSLGGTVLWHPVYPSDIAPSDYHIFGSMQQALSDVHFQLELPERGLKVIESNGEYFGWTV